VLWVLFSARSCWRSSRRSSRGGLAFADALSLPLDAKALVNDERAALMEGYSAAPRRRTRNRACSAPAVVGGRPAPYASTTAEQPSRLARVRLLAPARIRR
jgi:hypothetical protein